MSENIISEARLFLIESLRDQINPYEAVHPWRRNWKYAVLHSLRVEQNVLNILARESKKLSAVEVEILQLAAILHDLGKFVDREAHAVVGARIAETWLNENSNNVETITRIVDIIASHANKTGQESDCLKAILQDADVLDEIGAMSIMMTGNWIDRDSPFFFQMQHKRLFEFELPFCDEKMSVLNTRGAKQILMERRRFIEQYADQLLCEIHIDAEVEDMLSNLKA